MAASVDDWRTFPEHWLIFNFLHLLAIMDYLFAPVMTPECIDHLKVLIEEHHMTWKEIYPTCSITPCKDALLDSYPECIEKYVDYLHMCTCMLVHMYAHV